MRIVTLLAETDAADLWNNTVATAIVGSLLGVALWAFRRYWIVYIPAQEKIWAAEVKAKEAQERLQTTLSEVLPETNRLIAKMDARQEMHFASCQSTDRITHKNADQLNKISNHLGLQ